MKKFFQDFKLADKISLIIFFSSMLGLIFLDQLTKQLCHNLLRLGEMHQVIPNFFYITLAYNKGAAFSSFSGFTWLLTIISILAFLAILYIAIQLSYKKNTFRFIAFILFCAGCVGNLIDRALTTFGILEGVVDFLDFVIFGSHFATFNLADAFLSIAVVLLIIDLIILDTIRNKNKIIKQEEEIIESLENKEDKDESINC